MELQQNLELIFDVDAVLRGQGADAAILRARRPALVKVAEKARQESLAFLSPKVIYQEYADRVVGLHVRQSVDAIWTEALGDGDLDYAPMLKDLEARGFARPVVVEIAFEEATRITRSIAENNRLSLQWPRALTADG